MKVEVAVLGSPSYYNSLIIALYYSLVVAVDVKQHLKKEMMKLADGPGWQTALQACSGNVK